MNGAIPHNPTATADVCLLLEGTYPYIRGGVSSWVRQVIEGMPDTRFSIIFLGAKASEYQEPLYELPPNVIHLEVHGLLDGSSEERVKSNWWRRRRQRDRFAENASLHDALKDPDPKDLCALAQSFTRLLTDEGALSGYDLAHSRDAWNTIRDQYNDAPAGLDFNHYFWTVRSMHDPLFTLAGIARQAPQARLYHSVSTGYAGFLGALLQSKTGTPYIISEHGIYTKERELDLAQVDWIPEDLDPFKVGLNDNMSYLRQVWIRFFRSLGKMSYATASDIFTLYEGNRLRQISDGAPADRLTIIPNGINVKRFSEVRVNPNQNPPPVIGLIGRVVPIKDIKLFIRSMRIIRTQLPDVQGWLIGPQAEDPGYTEECKQLVQSLDLGDCIKFKGFQSPEEMLPQMGLNVLTSVSEGQPLVILEGYAAGIPTVTTNVGSCTELVFGTDEADRALGASGAVVPIADPAAFAEAVIHLLTDRQAWRDASAAAVARVERYYDDVDMIERYAQVYARHWASASTQAKAS